MGIRLNRRAGLLILGAVIVAVMAVLLLVVLGGGGPDYYTVGELLAQSTSLRGESVTVRGVVAPGSISWNEAAQIVEFTLADDAGGVEVVFEGMPPDDFGSGAELLVVGTYDADGVLQANHVREPGTMCAVCH